MLRKWLAKGCVLAAANCKHHCSCANNRKGGIFFRGDEEGQICEDVPDLWFPFPPRHTAAAANALVCKGGCGWRRSEDLAPTGVMSGALARVRATLLRGC